MNEVYDYCIVGSGPSGLTSSYNLLKANKTVLMLERDARSGGLAKSYNYSGHIFDTGPKRFHTEDKIVQEFLKEIMSMETIGRSTKVFFLDKYFDWPLNLKSIIKMPIHVAIKSMYDLINKEDIKKKDSFEDYIKFKYGDNLYNIFFKPYTEKFLRIPASEIHADWAMTGINRTVIDKKIKADNTWDIIKSLALPQKIDTKFLYPGEGGFGGFFDKLFSLNFDNKNFNIVFNSKIIKLIKSDDKFHLTCADGKQYSFKHLIWTGNLNDLVKLIDQNHKTNLNYINTIFYNFICKSKVVKNNKAQWIYISDGKKLISRITCMKEFSTTTTPQGYYNFIAEVTDSQSNPTYFNDPQGIKDKIINELKEIKFINNGDIDDIKVNSIKDTYPVYHKEYKLDFNKVTKLVKSFSKDISLLGRSGAYWYNNSDHSIRMAIEISNRLIKKTDSDFEFRKYF
jgi:protoporphyrinogen oxidase